jgi:hypothetical protein
MFRMALYMQVAARTDRGNEEEKIEGGLFRGLVSLREEVWKAGGRASESRELYNVVDLSTSAAVASCLLDYCHLPTSLQSTYCFQLEDTWEKAVGTGGLLNMTTTNA